MVDEQIIGTYTDEYIIYSNDLGGNLMCDPLYVSHTLSMVRIPEEVCPLCHPHLLPPGATIFSSK